MPNISEVNRELVKAFNINLRFNDIAFTNLTVQNLHGKDHIVISFDKNMDSKQCMKYLNNMKEKIIKRSYKDEKVANVSYSLQSFPFNFNKGRLEKDNKGKRFSVEIDERVVFNLKCYLAKALVGDIKEKMGSNLGVERIKKSIYDTNFDKNSYLYCMLFHDKGLQKDFVDSFSAEIEDYPNPPSDYLEEKGNLVYIKKGIFDDIEFIKDIIAYNASLECRYLQTPSAKNKTVDKLKYTMIDFIDRAAGIPVRTITRTSYVDKKEDSVLIPLVQNGKFLGFLSKDDAYDLNRTFGDAVVTRIESHRLKNPYWGSDYVYAIDFADVDISYCVLNKIMESSVINKDHELSIDPGLRFQALSRSPSTELSDTELESPTRSQGGALKDSPRQGSEREEETEPFLGVLGEEIGQASTSSQQTDMPSSSYTYIDKRDESMPEDSYFLPSMLTSFPHVITPLVHSVLTTRHDPMFPNHEFFARSSCFEDKNILSMKSEEHDKSEQGACSQVGVRALEGAQADDESMPIEIRDQQVRYRPSLTPFPTAWDNSMSLNFGVSEDSPEDTENICNEEHKEQKVTKEKEEEKLFKALLYWFNLNNYALDPPHTNFIVKNGKIASLIDDGVDVKEYLQEIINKTKEEYRVNKEKAYDFNEFPFQFLSNCEKNQETTVVANISRGALLNLKELFSREHEGKVEIKDIDINIVKKVVKSEKDKWVNSQVQEHGLSPKKAIKTCYPDESVLEYISITKDKGGYWINRDYDGSEVKSFRGERWLAKGTSKAEKMKPEDNKDSGYSSGFVTDAENVSSKAEATTSGYESMDCENTRGGSPKRTLELSVGMEELTISTDLYATKAEQHSPIKKFRSN